MSDIVTLKIKHKHGVLVLESVPRLQGDGAVERMRIAEKLREKLVALEEGVKERGESLDKLSDLSVDLDVKTSSLKAWISGAASSIMRGKLNDAEVGLLLDAAKALRIRDAVLKKVPAFPADESVLDLDGEETEVVLDSTEA